MPLPRDRIRRRRLLALASAAIVAAAAGAWAGASADDPSGPPARTESAAPAPRARPDARTADAAPADAAPSTAQLVREAGQTVVLRFNGTSAPPYVLRALRERRAAGVILFDDNLRTPDGLRAMTRALHRAAGGRALVMTDQEGGAVRTLPWAPPDAAPPALRTPAAAADAARATARGLRDAGIDVNLAPVADVGTWPGSIMRSRAFPGAGADVGRLVAATVRAYAGSGVLATVKHFPGLGRSTTNTDGAEASVAGAGDLEPFRAAIGAGVPLVMADHAVHRDLDPKRIASQSARTLTGLLRDRLGFRGACITDSLEAQAVVRRTSTATAALRSMRAGCDLLLTTGPGSYLRVLRRLVAAARADPQLRARLAEARARIRRLRPPAPARR